MTRTMRIEMTLEYDEASDLDDPLDSAQEWIADLLDEHPLTGLQPITMTSGWEEGSDEIEEPFDP